MRFGRGFAGVVIAAITVGAGAARAATPQHVVSLNVDGRDEMRIAAGNLKIEHLSWSQPTNLVVNGSPQALTWNGNTSDPVATGMTGDYWVRKSLGRDLGYAVQRSDGFALAAADNPNGSDTYEFQLFASPQANTTDWMRVKGGGATPGRMGYAGTAGYVPQSAGTETTFSLLIDGTDEIMFVNGALVIRHLSWSNPTSLTINGVPQTLNFSGNLSDPIALAMPDDLQFTQVGGRTTLYPVQTPVGLLIGADDELLGADTYTWKVTAVPEPSGVLVLLIAGPLVARLRRR